MSDPNHRTAITVAIIGVVGTIAAAAIANWDKIVGPRPEPAPAPVVNVPHEPPVEKPNITKKETAPSNALRIVSVDPPLGSTLHGETTFHIDVDYDLGSTDRAILMFGSSMYGAKSGGCVDFINYAGYEVRERIQRGTHRLSFTLPSGAEKIKGKGAIGFYALLMDADDWERGKKTLLTKFPVAGDYCYVVAQK